MVPNSPTGKTVTYTYDELNQLKKVEHPDGRTENYIYDAHGNLRLFNNGYTTHTYTYGNSDWKDLLTAVDGVTLTYDAIGNPLTYYNGESYSLSWTEGRKLAIITTDGKTTGYLYDANGNRIKKTNSDGSYIVYVNANGMTLGEKHYSADDELVKTLRYIYDENGSVCGYVSNSAEGGGTYHFIKNLQGDVIRVYRLGDNAIVASYSYDSWGNIISATGEKAQENPFRYRGYYYESETGFYYVSSRYYDPEIGRWINADNIVLEVVGNIYDYNLYAYCNQKQTNLISDDISFGEQTTGLYKSVRPEFSIPKNPTPDFIVYYDVPLYNQKGYSLCWAFCQVMVEDYKFGRTRTNEQATERAISISRSVYGDDWNKGGWPTNSRDLFGDTGITSLDDLYSALVGNGPIYAYYGGADGAHLVVITGVNKSKGIIYTNNPWGIAGEQTYSQFLHGFVGMPSYWDMPFGFYIFTQ